MLTVSVPTPRAILFCTLILALCTCLPARAQQGYVPRYDLFTGYSHLSSPSVSLQQNGFNASFGGNLLRWLAVGADFSVFKGDGSIELAKTKVASQLARILLQEIARNIDRDIGFHCGRRAQQNARFAA